MQRSIYLANTSTNNFVETMKICCCALQGVRHLNNSAKQHNICINSVERGCPGTIQALFPLAQSYYKNVEKSSPAKDDIVNDDRDEIYDECTFYDEQEILKKNELFYTEVDACFQYLKEDSKYLETVKKLRNVFLDALLEDAKRYCVGDQPGEIPNTRDQRNSEVWRAERSIRFPASMAKQFLRLPQSLYAQALKEHLWTLLPATDNVYGIEMEKTALEEYIKWAQTQDETAVVQETGMWINPSFPQLSCSPDGLVTSEKFPPRLLEIKCPEVMRNCSVSDFTNSSGYENVNPAIFCLQTNSDGSLSLKKNSTFWFQIQVSMGILNIKESHFMVWSPYGFIVDTVKFDPEWWESTKKKLIQLHAELWVPEYFLMRTPRFLRPLRIPLDE